MMQSELIAVMVAVPLAVVGLATAIVKRPGNGKLNPGQQAILNELQSINGALGRIEVHQEALATAQAATAEGLAYMKGRMDGAPGG